MNENYSFQTFSKEVLYFFIFVLSGVLGANLIDILLNETVVTGVRPVFNMEYHVRAVLTFFLTLGLVLIFWKRNQSTTGGYALSQELNEDHGWPSVSLSRKKRLWALGFVIFFSVLYVSVCHYDMLLFKNMSSDEKPVENLSAAFSLVSCIICLVMGLKIRMSKSEGYKAHSWLAFMFSFIFFVICMEETGWTHGVFGFTPPDYMIQGNAQGEMNLHNHATYQFELAYYFSTFLFFIVLPFMNDIRPSFKKVPVISFFIPSRLMVYVGAIAMAYNYDMWNKPFFQMSFYLTGIILAYYIWVDRSDKHQRILFTLFAIYIFSQISFLALGYQTSRTQSFKEYKEFFIPLTFVIYSMELFIRTKIAIARKKF